MNAQRLLLPWGFFLLAILCCVSPGQAQLATSFYNITGIQTKVLPNAVRITITTDGTVIFGADQNEFVEIQDGRSVPKTVTSLRLRFLRARSRLPAFTDIGTYPVDSAMVTLGRDTLARPIFGPGGNAALEPRVDIQFRFYVPVTVQRFSVADQSSGLRFRDTLSARDVAVELGPDRRSVIITVVPDRTDFDSAARLLRSPPEKHNRRLAIDPVASTLNQRPRFRIDALHTPLADVLIAASRIMRLPLIAQPDVATIDTSLLLMAATPEEFLDTLSTTYGVFIAPRSGNAGGFVIGRSGPLATTERLPLRHLTPQQARLLFPDFLLPVLRADLENNALIVTGPPELVARVRRDLTVLDQPRAQVRVEATVWELSSQDDLDFALRAARAHGQWREALDTATGEISIGITPEQRRSLTVTVEALATRRRARLLARPFVVVASGERGTLFLGQSRFVQVIKQRGDQQDVEAIELQIGYSLSVRPVVGAAEFITLELNPRVSTVDAIEDFTRLPTLGIREATMVARVRPDDAILLAGLDSTLDFSTRGQMLLPASRRNNRAQTNLMILVTARRV